MPALEQMLAEIGHERDALRERVAELEAALQACWRETLKDFPNTYDMLRIINDVLSKKERK